MSERALITVNATAVWEHPSAVRPVDEAAVRPIPDLAEWRARIDGADHLGLVGRAVTTALLGELVMVVSERAGWSEIRLPDQPSSLAEAGYPGWVPSSHLISQADADRDRPGILAPPHREWATVDAALTLTAVDDEGTPVVMSLGTRLPLAQGAGSGALLHPDGRLLHPDGSVSRSGPQTGTAQRVIELARGFVGTPYFWAGLSGFGVDCSGLVHLCYRTVGITLPRDAHDQAAFARAVPLEQLQPADAVFFENATGIHHVGLAIGDGMMVHSPNCDRLVSIDRILSHAEDGERVTAGRFVNVDAYDGRSSLTAPIGG